ncbi:MAG TPA: hypothetical protein VNQ79_19435 [Blastocatellia bacterium]|nr:hypothetical protein [Blastocatellia bacterium]
MKTKLPLITFLLLATAATALAQADIIYTGTAQPSAQAISITGAQRGTTVTMVVDGLNLGGTSDVIFNASGFTARVLAFAEQLRDKPKPIPLTTVIADKATKNRVTIELTVAPNVEPGIYAFRLKTPMGTTNARVFVVTPFAETMDRGMNQSIETAQEITLPTTITGNLSRNGEADYFRFRAQAGQQIVFDSVAAVIGSRLNPVITLFDISGNQLAMNDDFNGRADALLGYTFKEAGEYVVRITDAESKGAPGQFEYRLNVGEFAYLTNAFPLGLKQGSSGEVTLSGFNLGSGRQKVTAPAAALWDQGLKIRGSGSKGESLNTLKLDAGRWPEIIESENNNSLAAAQPVQLPVTINGRIFSNEQKVADDYYRFTARKGQLLILEVAAQRFGSPLDSVIEVLDAKGQQIPRAVLRAVLATETTLNDRDSAGSGLRLLNWNGMAPGDFLLVGSELLQIERLPYFPDDDTIVRSFNGIRYGFEDTTPEARAMGTAVYKVTIHPPGTTFPSNGLPVTTLYYRNDDAGPRYGMAGLKDSLLHFTAPADGEYIARIRDVRGLSGERFAYRLAIHEPQPDFALVIDPENPNVPLGGSRDLRVTAMRLDDFDGEIEVRLLNLPPGFTATTARIPAGQHIGQIILSASPDAKGSFMLKAQGAAIINGRKIIREARNDQMLSVVSTAPPPEVLVYTSEQRVNVAPGEEAFISISIKRQHGFAGRVPFDVVGLPPGVTLRDLGLNGIMITEGETTQRFRLEVQPWVKPLEQQIFVVGKIETTGMQQQRFPAAPVLLSIRPKESRANNKPR